jgi:hypothetical protein
MLCTEEGPEIRPCLDWESYPSSNSRILAIRLGRNGYTVLTGRRGALKTQDVFADEIKLTDLVRALVARSALPTTDLRKIPASYWNSRPQLSLRAIKRTGKGISD